MFHLAFKVKDIESTRAFYINLLGCTEGRSTKNWIDFDFFGNQLTGHVSDNIPELDYCGQVDGKQVPIPHFGPIISIQEFKDLQQKLEASDVYFILSAQTRYKSQAGEQMTMFFQDFSGNPIEVKAFQNPEEVFKK